MLSDISFDLQPGEVLGVVGESGAGKSMIGRLISQMLPGGFKVASGALQFDGEDLLRAVLRRVSLNGHSHAGSMWQWPRAKTWGGEGRGGSR